jgi:hypothetical protein
MSFKQVLRLGLLGLLLSGPGSAQIVPLPASGDSYQLLRGVLPSVELVRARDGKLSERLILDPADPELSHTSTPINGGVRHVLRGKLLTQSFGSIPIDVSVDVYRRGGTSFDLTLHYDAVPSELAVQNLGLVLEFVDQPGVQCALVPAFSGSVFEEPASSIRATAPIDLGFAASMQCSSYWSRADGSGLQIRMLDPTGNEPKRMRYEPLSLSAQPVLRMDVQYWLPETELGGQARSTPYPIRIEGYGFDPNDEAGWRPAAALYREWLVQEATETGELLERGPLADRQDMPSWVQNLDLLVTEQFGWYPAQSLVPDPLLAVERHKKELGARNILLALWSSGDLSSPYGLAGSWFPRAGSVKQFKKLRDAEVYVSTYTYPQVFDLRNPLLFNFQLWRGAVERRNGSFVITSGNLGEPYLLMDVADPTLTNWFSLLAQFQARDLGVSGFYTDLPVAAGTPDFRRPLGLPTGTSRVGYEGFARLHRAMQKGASSVKRDFVSFHESCFEWLVRASTLGQGTTDLFGRAYPNETRSYSAPFFQSVFSGYTSFWPADPGLGTQTLEFVPDAYGPLEQFNISRLLAEGVTLGAVPNTSELFLREGLLFYEKKFGDPPLDDWLQHHRQVLGEAVALRQKARDWLAFGQMLNDPWVEGDVAKMELNVAYAGVGIVSETYSKRVVSCAAWRSPDDETRIILFNGSDGTGTAVLEPRRLGMRSTRALVDVQTQESFEGSWNSQLKRWWIKVPVEGGKWRILAPR